jgi:glutamyl-tRNA synthetase
MDVRVRFAPSPTGFLHIGGARTALFNWLFAKSHNGKFFLRIEDTDRSRSTEAAILAIIDAMNWLGLSWDSWEGSDSDPVRQTERFNLYRERALSLLERGLAYRCYCTAAELEQRRKEAMEQGRVPRYDGRCRSLSEPSRKREFALRFAASEQGDIVIDDMVKGRVVFDSSVVDDLIILRSDGTPTYNFCVVVDDVDMQITHVIRGDDHLNNTPRQIALYRAFGYPLPVFGHLSMILGADKARLSKRHGAVSVQSYREDGYLPEAMLNYLVRLGWSFKDQEIFSIDELIQKFSMDQVGSSAAMFNPEKLLWINAHYIKIADPVKLLPLIRHHLEQRGIKTDDIDLNHIKNVIALLQTRSRTVRELADSADYFFAEEIVVNDKADDLLTEKNLPILQAVYDQLLLAPFERSALEELFKGVGIALGYKLSEVAQPVRAAVTGTTVSPGLFDVLVLLGREATLKRLYWHIQLLSSPDV